MCLEPLNQMEMRCVFKNNNFYTGYTSFYSLDKTPYFISAKPKALHPKPQNLLCPILS